MKLKITMGVALEVSGSVLMFLLISKRAIGLSALGEYKLFE